MKLSSNKQLYNSFINLIILNLNNNFNFYLYPNLEINKKNEIIISVYKHIKIQINNKINNNDDFKTLIIDIFNRSIENENYEMSSVLRDILNNETLINSLNEIPKKKPSIKIKKN